ncbi:hypothetical protein [Nonomuraea sp. NPDC023979]|uniref:hypothetical protein n=1 Tax=Nonomuraea sp. NPDC023979 TaxID=3154796 RepID=UPI0033F1C4DB
MTLFIVLAAVAGYLAIGLGYIAPRWAAREVENDIRQFGILAKDPGRIAEWRRDAAGFSVGIALVWPGYLVCRWLVDQIVHATPPSSHELKALNEQQARRIAELERELGIGERP